MYMQVDMHATDAVYLQIWWLLYWQSKKQMDRATIHPMYYEVKWCSGVLRVCPSLTEDI